MAKRLIITFSGDKEGLYKQLKIWSANNDKSMNSKIIDLIQGFLNE